MTMNNRELNVSSELLDHRTMLVMTVDRPLVQHLPWLSTSRRLAGRLSV